VDLLSTTNPQQFEVIKFALITVSGCGVNANIWRGERRTMEVQRPRARLGIEKHLVCTINCFMNYFPVNIMTVYYERRLQNTVVTHLQCILHTQSNYNLGQNFTSYCTNVSYSQMAIGDINVLKKT